MKKEEVPQDPGALSKVTKEVCYALDESGRYGTSLSAGWAVKASALDVAWKDVEARIALAKQRVTDKTASPLLYFMELHVMDIAIVSAYTGFWKWQVKRHLRYAVFEKLSPRRLQQYAELFNVSIAALKNMQQDEA